MVLLHTKLGKPIPPQEPEVIGGARKSVSSTPKINFVQSGGLGIPAGNGDTAKEEEEETPEPDIQPVGQDYIEEIKSDDGKVFPSMLICTYKGFFFLHIEDFWRHLLF